MLAVSGGVDSVALCELCKQAGYDFTIAHCNFQLRGEESKRDEEFVRKLGEKYKVEVKVKKFGTEKFAEENFNACLLNLYRNGSEGMAWHSDDEKEILRHSCIASLSLGAKRRFDFKHKINGDKFCIDLEHGSLLLMKSDIQEHWMHALPKQLRVKEARINLTFRMNKNG